MMFSSIFGANKPDFFVCYAKVPTSQIQGFNTVFLESAFYNHAEVELLKKNNKKVYAYISLTEVSKHNTGLYQKLSPYLLSENSNWNSAYINISKAKARAILIDEIATIYSKGFDGLLLDNLDNASIHGPYKVLQSSLIQLIEEINHKFSDKDLIQNGGLFLLEKTHTVIKGILVESVFTDYDFQLKTYKIRNKQEAVLKKTSFINTIKHYKLKGYVIEYASQKSVVQKIYRKYNLNQLSVVVTDINLSNNLK